MTESGEQQIIRLLTEMRDAQQADRELQAQLRAAHKETEEKSLRVMDESVALQKRAARLQRTALPGLLIFVIVMIALLYFSGGFGRG